MTDSDHYCIHCGDTGVIQEPPRWPEGLSLRTHTWDQLRKMVKPGRVFACPKCWRGQMAALTAHLEKYAT